MQNISISNQCRSFKSAANQNQKELYCQACLLPATNKMMNTDLNMSLNTKRIKNDEEQQEHKQFMTQAPWSLSSDRIIFIWMKKNKQVFVI